MTDKPPAKRSGPQSVPANAFTLNAGEITVGCEGDPLEHRVSLLARSDKPINHWYWGDVVHDLSGAKVGKKRIPIDYAHNNDEVIGFLDTFTVEKNGLRTDGQLVVFRDDDRAAEVAYKSQQGIPFEASINFGGDGIKLEELAEGETTEVNGFEFSGPGVVVREWPLRGVAICPYGADAQTETNIFKESDSQVLVEFIKTERNGDMAAKKKTDKDAAQLDAVAELETEEKVVEVETDDEAAEVEQPVAEAKQPAADDKPAAAVTMKPKFTQQEGQRFIDAFGEQGAVWFIEGRSFEEAQEIHVAQLSDTIEALADENEALQSRLDMVEDGEEDPCEFSAAPVNEEQGNSTLRNNFARSMPMPAAAFAARFEGGASEN